MSGKSLKKKKPVTERYCCVHVKIAFTIYEEQMKERSQNNTIDPTLNARKLKAEQLVSEGNNMMAQ